mmetsp:Transcript_19646/g.40753  ORF Transcript_19646/g.40753 Transcript_19646/m.40753 type:complete len:426 (+) Transcript_19646:134-1411(+)
MQPPSLNHLTSVVLALLLFSDALAHGSDSHIDSAQGRILEQECTGNTVVSSLSPAYDYQVTMAGDPALIGHWSIDSESETISFRFCLSRASWLGVGFSPDGEMPGSDAVIMTGSDYSDVKRYEISGYSTSSIAAAGTQLLQDVGSGVNASTGETCMWYKRPLTPENDIAIVEGQAQHLIWAHGEAGNPTLSHHSKSGSLLMDFYACSAKAEESDHKYVLLVHGLLMFGSFCVVMPLSVLVSRFGKARFGEGRWLALHKAAALCCCIFIVAGWFVANTNRKGMKSKYMHKTVGLLLVLLAVFVQPLLGIFRPANTSTAKVVEQVKVPAVPTEVMEIEPEGESEVSKNSARLRRNWELVHKNLGRFMVVLGFFQSYTGIEAALPAIGEDSRTISNLILFVSLFAALSSYSFFEKFKGTQNRLELEHV